MKKVVLLLGIIIPFAAISQKTITGKVFDAANNRPLAQATIVMKNGNTGTVSNNDGDFVLKLPDNAQAITVSYAGYENFTVVIKASTTDYLIGLKLFQNLRDIVVIGSRNVSRTKVQTPVPVDVIPIASIASK